MGELVLTHVEHDLLHQLQMRAARHGREPGEEAKAILSEALHAEGMGPWAPVDSIFSRLAATGQTFSDSAELLREDRDR